MENLKTIRGQAARIVENNGKYSIELYANGEWGKPCSGYDKQFDTENEALEFFKLKRDCIHS